MAEEILYSRVNMASGVSYPKSFFTRFILLLVILGGIHRFAEGVLHLVGFRSADAWLGFYGYPEDVWYNMVLIISSLPMVWGAWILWNGTYKSGFTWYMTGKLLLLAGAFYAIIADAAASGRSFPWDTLLALLGIWICFPILIFTHRKYRTHGRIRTAG